MKKTPIKRGKPLRPTGYLRRTGRLRKAVSDKKRDRISELDAITPALEERSKGICEICGAAKAVHRHHRLRQGQGGKHTLANLLHLCEKCHSYVHLQPTESYRQGWLLLSGKGSSVECGPSIGGDDG